MKPKKQNAWLPVTIVLGCLIAAIIVLIIVMVLVNRPHISASGKESTPADTEITETADTYVEGMPLDEFSTKSGQTVAAEAEDDNNPEAAMDNPDGFLLPESADRELTEDDLEGMTAQELNYAKNEIYARHGRVFQSSELNDYFSTKNWYEADEDFEDKDLSKLEAKNADFIAKYQKDNDLTYKPAK